MYPQTLKIRLDNELLCQIKMASKAKYGDENTSKLIRDVMEDYLNNKYRFRNGGCTIFKPHKKKYFYRVN